MGLTPKHDPVPKLAQTTGATGTFNQPDTITVKDGAVIAADTSGNTSTASTTGTSAGLIANAPLNRTGDTLTIPQASASADGYLSGGDYAAFASVSTFGTLADRPITPVTIGNQAPLYFAVDVPAIYIWSGTMWFQLCTCQPSSSSSSSSNSSSSSSSSM